MLFVDRERELDVLRRAYGSRGRELVVVYGRRRIGKTFLLRFFQRRYGGVYLVVNYSDRVLVLRDLTRQLNEEYEAGVGVFESFRDFYRSVLWIAERYSRGKPVVILDEAQRLTGTGGLSELQYLWDTLLGESNVLFILSGSSVGVITRSLLGYESPLYGRATRILYLDQFGYREARVFMEKWDPVDRVRGYSVYGGTPAYLSLIDASKSLDENIYEHILDPSSFLHHDPFYMLSIETREPQRYLAVLSAIAHGRNRVGQISSYTGLPANIVSKYLYVLEKALGFIKKIYPLGTEGKKKYGVYVLTDNYYKFWFRTIYPRLGDPSLHTRDYLSKVMNSIDTYASEAWETIAEQHLHILREMKVISFSRIGRWWHKNIEIDRVALDDESKTAYFIECKWSKTPVTWKHLRKLKEKSSRTPWKKWRHKYIFYTLSEPSIEASDMVTYTLKDVEAAFEKYKPMVKKL